MSELRPSDLWAGVALLWLGVACVAGLHIVIGWGVGA